MIKNFVYFIFILSTLSGCTLDGPEELDRLTKEDPQFKQMILARDQVHAQSRTIKEDLLLKKKALDEQIGSQRQEYDTYAKAQNLKIEKMQLLIEANRDRLRQEIEAASSALKAKTEEMYGYAKTLEDVKKVLREGKGISFSTQEKQKWDERIIILQEKIRPLADEIQDLKLEMRLKKRKIVFLR